MGTDTRELLDWFMAAQITVELVPKPDSEPTETCPDRVWARASRDIAGVDVLVGTATTCHGVERVLMKLQDDVVKRLSLPEVRRGEASRGN